MDSIFILLSLNRRFMPINAVAINHVVFLDPSDPRIPSYNTCSNTHFGDNGGQSIGWNKNYVVIITKEDTAAAKAAGSLGLKPYESDPDSTNTFFAQYPLTPVPYNPLPSGDGMTYGSSHGSVKYELEKIDRLRILYPNWVAEEQRNPKWYDEIQNASFILLIAKGPYLDNAVATSMSKVVDRQLSDGRSLAELAKVYYEIHVHARKSWWAKYDELLPTIGQAAAHREADKAQEAVLNQFKENGRRRQGGRRKRRATRRR